ncbi:MAG: response regulator [Desulfomicrobiaceae bacterium]|nr:response regulator [Desulfomicrobiaceae bacterium]
MKRLLVVDDDPLFRAAVAHWLTEEGYCVSEAADAASALQCFTETPPHGVLLDLILGEDDTLSLLQTMHDLRPYVPVLVISAKNYAQSAAQAFKAGAWDYIIKPIASLEILAQTIRNCLEQSQLQERMRATQARLHTLIHNLPIILFSFTKDLDFTFLTHKTEHVLGYSVAELQNYPLKFLHLIHKDDRKIFLNNISKIFDGTHFTSKLDFRFTHKQGYPLVLQVHFIASRYESEPRRVEGILLDITHHTYLDRMFLSNERQMALHTLAQELAHEVRNPLVALGGLTRILEERYPDDAECALLRHECRRLDSIWERLEPLLDPPPAAIETISIASAVTFIFRILSHHLERMGITWEVREDAAPLVQASTELTHRALLSVIQYAQDNLAAGGHILARTLREEKTAGVSLEISPAPLPHVRHQHLDVCRRLMARQNGSMESHVTAQALIVHLHLPCTHPGLVSAATFS